jgi:hypothetical protein
MQEARCFGKCTLHMPAMSSHEPASGTCRTMQEATPKHSLGRSIWLLQKSDVSPGDGSPDARQLATIVDLCCGCAYTFADLLKTTI